MLRQQLVPPRKSSAEHDAKTQAYLNPSDVVGEGREKGAQSDAKAKAQAHGDSFLELAVLFVGHTGTLQVQERRSTVDGTSVV